MKEIVSTKSNMKEWKAPELEVLDLKNTEFGTESKTVWDATYNDGHGHVFYSYS